MPEAPAPARRDLPLLARPKVLGGAAAVLLAVLAVVVLLASLPNLLGSLNPFGTEERDRSGPVVIRSLQRIQELHAATANLQEVLDIEQDDSVLPSFLRGERTVFLAAGSADGIVDLSSLGADAVRVDEDRDAVTVTLPAPTVGKVRLDVGRSRVLDRDRGLLDRAAAALGEDVGSEQELLRRAQDKLQRAAEGDASLHALAEDNTRTMLTELLHGLGFSRVTVRFAPPLD